MKLLISWLTRLIIEVFTIATSKDRLKRLFHIPLYSNALYLMVANAANALIGFVFWIIVARFYSPEDVGFASAAISAVSLLAMLANLGLGYGLIRFLPHSGENANNMINSCFTIGGIVSIVAVCVFLFGLGLWSPALLPIRQDCVYLVAFVLFTIALTLSLLTEQTFVAERRTGFVLAKNLIFNVLRLPFVLLLALFFQSFGIFSSWGISLAVALFVSVFVFLPRIRFGYRPSFTVDKGAVKDILRFSFANHIGNLFWTAPASILPIMVINMLGAELNAYFYIAWAIGSVLTMIPTVSALSLFAEGSYDEDKLEQNIWRSLKMVFVILLPVAMLILALADKILLLFGGSYSENAATLLRLLSIAALPLAINAVYLGIKRVEKKPKVIIGLTAFMAAVTLGLSFLLLPRLGISGVGIAWLISQGIIALAIIAGLLKSRLVKRKVEL